MNAWGITGCRILGKKMYNSPRKKKIIKLIVKKISTHGIGKYMKYKKKAQCNMGKKCIVLNEVTFLREIFPYLVSKNPK